MEGKREAVDIRHTIAVKSPVRYLKNSLPPYSIIPKNVAVLWQSGVSSWQLLTAPGKVGNVHKFFRVSTCLLLAAIGSIWQRS